MTLTKLGDFGAVVIISYNPEGRSQVRLREDIRQYQRFKPINSNNQTTKALRQVKQISASLQKSSKEVEIKNYQSMNQVKL